MAEVKDHQAPVAKKAKTDDSDNGGDDSCKVSLAMFANFEHFI
jgi:hypothetical protein